MLRECRIDELLGAHRTVFPEIWDTVQMEETVESNAWHQHQSVLDHSYEVFEALARVSQLQIDHMDRLRGHKRQFEEYVQSPLASGRSRLMCLQLAALFHDVGKVSTLNKDDYGNTTCNGHDKMSLQLMGSRFPLSDADDADIDYIRRIVALHHSPDIFLDVIGHSGFAEHKLAFIRGAAELSIDALIFYLADFEGGKVDANVEASKELIYRTVAETICDCLESC